jgi:hypothetical protein
VPYWTHRDHVSPGLTEKYRNIKFDRHLPIQLNFSTLNYGGDTGDELFPKRTG